jgi:methyl-accepting chemotaxis protein
MKRKQMIPQRIVIGAAMINAAYLIAMAGCLGWAIFAGHISMASPLLPVLVFCLLAVGIAVMYLAKRAATNFASPLRRLQSTLDKIADGDLDARVSIRSGDEFEQIGQSIDELLADRVSALSRMEEENEELNDSIVALLETVARLAQKDLTIRARVREDITGPLADALNMMTNETGNILKEVTEISGEVAEASNIVKSKSDSVLDLARKEQQEVDEAARELTKAAEAMFQIANLAHASNKAADAAIGTTMTALTTVNDTVASINSIRDSISETEKRIKRLGERSQEISGVVSLINSIAERTHILALNASMHAASAGEAGRGFAVVADEVQRLAENAREATSQIATMVKNIQVETGNTVNTMNELISQVVGGSQLAEQAGEKMKQTHNSTAELVGMVQKIARSAVDQAKVSKLLRERTELIRRTVHKTGTQLNEQSSHTDKLVEHAMALVASVGVFQLPEEETVIH